MADIADHSSTAGITTTDREQRFETVLAREPFKGLKAILDHLSADRAALCAGIYSSETYEDLVANLGYRLTLTNQIHVNDCFSRVGAAGGIKAVLPYYDIPTQSSLPTLVNLDSTLTTTAKATLFFNKMLASFKTQLSLQG